MPDPHPSKPSANHPSGSLDDPDSESEPELLRRKDYPNQPQIQGPLYWTRDAILHRFGGLNEIRIVDAVKLVYCGSILGLRGWPAPRSKTQAHPE